MTPRFEPFEGKDGQWYWRLVAGNGHIVAVGGEGFTTEEHAREAVPRIRAIVAEAEFDEAPVNGQEDTGGFEP